MDRGAARRRCGSGVRSRPRLDVGRHLLGARQELLATLRVDLRASRFGPPPGGLARQGRQHPRRLLDAIDAAARSGRHHASLGGGQRADGVGGDRRSLASGLELRKRLSCTAAARTLSSCAGEPNR